MRILVGIWDSCFCYCSGYKVPNLFSPIRLLIFRAGFCRIKVFNFFRGHRKNSLGQNKFPQFSATVQSTWHIPESHAIVTFRNEQLWSSLEQRVSCTQKCRGQGLAEAGGQAPPNPVARLSNTSLQPSFSAFPPMLVLVFKITPLHTQ